MRVLAPGVAPPDINIAYDFGEVDHQTVTTIVMIGGESGKGPGRLTTFVWAVNVAPAPWPTKRIVSRQRFRRLRAQVSLDHGEVQGLDRNRAIAGRTYLSGGRPGANPPRRPSVRPATR